MQHTPAENLDYWADILEQDYRNEQLNAFSFEEKYNIIAHALGRIGIHSHLSYEDLESNINDDPFEDLFNEDLLINMMLYWIIGLWGSYLMQGKDENGSYRFLKPSDQLWYFDGEQDEIKYLDYCKILHRMRGAAFDFEAGSDTYSKEEDAFRIDFKYKGNAVHWKIPNGGKWLQDEIFYEYTKLCKPDYESQGEYYIVGEGQGGYILFLSDQAEEYLRKIWDFPKLNKWGKMRTLAVYSIKGLV